jgi:hypothetical protein
LPEGDDAYFELSFSPSVGLVSTVRRFVTNFYDQILEDAEVTSKVAVATHELLENAVRYSTDGQTCVRVGVRREGRKTFTVTIDTSNRTKEEHVVFLTALMDEMQRSSDPEAFYQTLMARSAKRTDGSGLGLGRIRAEADMTLTHEIKGDRVHLHAQARFESAGRP